MCVQAQLTGYGIICTCALELAWMGLGHHGPPIVQHRNFRLLLASGKKVDYVAAMTWHEWETDHEMACSLCADAHSALGGVLTLRTPAYICHGLHSR